MIDGYNNGAITSKKRILEDRQQYLENYWGGTLDDFTKRKLVLYDIIFRLCHSSEEKYVGFFKELCQNLSVFGIKEPENEKKIKILKEFYDIYERTSLKEDPYLEFSHEIEKSYSQTSKTPAQGQALKAIYRLLEDIKAQKHKILSAGFKDPNKNEAFFEFPDEYLYKNPLNLEDLDREIVAEGFYEPKERKVKNAKKDKNKEKNGDFVEIGIENYETLENYFKEFMEKYEGMIKTNRFFIDILLEKFIFF